MSGKKRLGRKLRRLQVRNEWRKLKADTRQLSAIKRAIKRSERRIRAVANHGFRPPPVPETISFDIDSPTMSVQELIEYSRNSEKKDAEPVIINSVHKNSNEKLDGVEKANPWVRNKTKPRHYGMKKVITVQKDDEKIDDCIILHPSAGDMVFDDKKMS